MVDDVRFVEMMCEVEGVASPYEIRSRELKKLIAEQLEDFVSTVYVENVCYDILTESQAAFYG